MTYAFTPETLGEHWGVSAATVRNLVREGSLRAFRVGTQIRIRREDVGNDPPRRIKGRANFTLCGVYILFLQDAPAYVGRSTDLRARIATHRRSGRAFDRVETIECAAETASWLEAELVRTLRPSQNVIRFERRARRAAESQRGLQ